MVATARSLGIYAFWGASPDSPGGDTSPPTDRGGRVRARLRAGRDAPNLVASATSNTGSAMYGHPRTMPRKVGRRRGLGGGGARRRRRATEAGSIFVPQGAAAAAGRPHAPTPGTRTWCRRRRQVRARARARAPARAPSSRRGRVAARARARPRICEPLCRHSCDGKHTGPGRRLLLQLPADECAQTSCLTFLLASACRRWRRDPVRLELALTVTPPAAPAPRPPRRPGRLLAAWPRRRRSRSLRGARPRPARPGLPLTRTRTAPAVVRQRRGREREPLLDRLRVTTATRAPARDGLPWAASSDSGRAASRFVPPGTTRRRARATLPRRRLADSFCACGERAARPRPSAAAARHVRTRTKSCTSDAAGHVARRVPRTRKRFAAAAFRPALRPDACIRVPGADDGSETCARRAGHQGPCAPTRSPARTLNPPPSPRPAGPRRRAAPFDGAVSPTSTRAKTRATRSRFGPALPRRRGPAHPRRPPRTEAVRSAAPASASTPPCSSRRQLVGHQGTNLPRRPPGSVFISAGAR